MSKIMEETIKNIMLKKMKNNELVLPSLQREFVWDIEQIENLFDSLLQDYPIGTMLFWKTKKQNYIFYKFINDYSENAEKRHNTQMNLNGIKEVTAVLDGQQRLTAMYIGLCGSYEKRKKHVKEAIFEKYKLYLNLVYKADEDIESTDNRFMFKFKKPADITNNEKEYWFEVGKVLDFEKMSNINKEIDKMKKLKKYNNEQIEYAENLLSDLFTKINIQPEVKYYEEETEDLDKVLNIFIRTNNGGKKLNYADLLLSVAAVQWKENAREEINAIVDELNSTSNKQYNFNKDFVLKACLVLLDLPDVRFRVENFTKDNMKKIEDNFKDICASLKKAVEVISKYGYNGKRLVANNAIIPIVYYIYKKNYFKKNFAVLNQYKEERKQIIKWLDITLLKSVFSSQTDTILKDIRDIVKENLEHGFPIKQIAMKYKNTPKSIEFTDDEIDELLNLTYRDEKTFLVLSLLYMNKSEGTYEVDHIQPRAKFEKENITEDKYQYYMKNCNNIGNLELLDYNLNEEKGEEYLSKWLEEKYPDEKSKKEFLQENLINSKYIEFKDFYNMVEERKKDIKANLIEKLKI